MSDNKLNIINPLEWEGWDDLISGHQDSTIFHTSSWARVMAESYGYSLLYFTKINAGIRRNPLPKELCNYVKRNAELFPPF